MPILLLPSSLPLLLYPHPILPNKSLPPADLFQGKFVFLFLSHQPFEICINVSLYNILIHTYFPPYLYWCNLILSPSTACNFVKVYCVLISFLHPNHSRPFSPHHFLLPEILLNYFLFSLSWVLSAYIISSFSSFISRQSISLFRSFFCRLTLPKDSFSHFLHKNKWRTPSILSVFEWIRWMAHALFFMGMKLFTAPNALSYFVLFL